MQYNVQSQSDAQNTLNKIKEQGWNLSPLSNPISMDSFRSWKIRLSHITTSMNGCSSIQKRGLTCFSEALTFDSEITTMLNAARIKYIDGSFYCKTYSGSYLPIQSDWLGGISREDCVNAFLFHAEQMDEYDKSPDVLRKIAKSGIPQMKGILKNWEDEAHPYEVLFDVSPQDIDIVTGEYAHNENTLEELLGSLITICRDIAEGYIPAHGVLPVALKQHVKIPASKLTIRPLCRDGR